MFVTINDTQYNTLEFTAYRVLSTKEHPIGVEVHFVGGMKLIKDFDTEAEREEFISILGSTYVELSNIFYNAMYFTAYYKEDVVLDSPSYNVVAHYNGPTKLVFKFETEAARDEFVEKLDAMSLGGMTQKDTFADFPKTGSPSGIYLAKDTGQMYFWDEVLKTYEKLGVSRKGGVYSYNNVINNTIGHISTIKKSDLTELVKPSVAFMDGSEVIGNNSVRGVITQSDAETVTVRTITDLVIDSFVQVDTEAELPEHGAENVLYFRKDINTMMYWDGVNYKFTDSVKHNGYLIMTLNIAAIGGIGRRYVEAYLKEHLYPKLEKPEDLKNVLFIVCNNNIRAILHTDSVGSPYNFFGYGDVTLSDSAGSGDKDVCMLTSHTYKIVIGVNKNKPEMYTLDNWSFGHDMLGFLSTSDNREEKPFVPTKLNHPANKKYVDDSIEALFFEGDEDEYNALTQEEKDAFLIAIVNPLVDPENPVVETINEIAGDKSETEIDLTDEELEGAMDEIIGG